MKKVEEIILDEDNEVVLDEDHEVVLYEPGEFVSNPGFLMDGLFEEGEVDTPVSSKLASSSIQTVETASTERPAEPAPAECPAEPAPAHQTVEPFTTGHGMQSVEAVQAPVAAQLLAGATPEGVEGGGDAPLSLVPRSDMGVNGVAPGSRGSTRRLAYVWGFVTLLTLAITLLSVIYPDGFRRHLSSVPNGQWGVGQSDKGGVASLLGANHEGDLGPWDAQDSGKGSAADGSDGTAGQQGGEALQKAEERPPRQLAMRGADTPRSGGEELSTVPRPEEQYVASLSRGQDSFDAAGSASGTEGGGGPNPTGAESSSDAVADRHRLPPARKLGEIESQPLAEAGKADLDASRAPDPTGNTAPQGANRGASADSSRSPIAESLVQGGAGNTEVHGRTGAADSRDKPVRYEIVLPTAMHSRASTLSPIVDILQPGEHAVVVAHIAGTRWYRVMGALGVHGFVYASLHAQPSTAPGVRPGSEPHPRLAQLNEADTGIGEIPWMIRRAEEHFKADRLMAPKFKNALSLYREVLRLDPNNPQAQEGIRRIKAKLSRYSLDAENLGDMETARSLLMKILMVDPTDREAKARLAGFEETP